MNKKFDPKEFLNIKILDTSENQTIRGGEDQKQKRKQKNSLYLNNTEF